MFVRFQFKSTTFAELVRDRIARSDIGCIRPTGSGFVVERIVLPRGGPAPMNVDRSGEVVVLPTLAIGGIGPIETVPSLETGFEELTVPVVGADPMTIRRRRILLTVPVTLTVRQLDNLIAGTDPALTFTIDVVLAVDLVHRGTDFARDYLEVRYRTLAHHEGTNWGIEALVAAELRGLADEPPQRVEIDYAEAILEALEFVGGEIEPPKVCWSGLTLSGDRQTVELRFELTFDDRSGTHRPNDWRRFYNQEIGVFRGDRDWAAAISRDLLLPSIRAGALADIEAYEQFDLDSAVEVAWRPDLGGVRTTFHGELNDACTCFFVSVDVNVEITATTTVQLVDGGSTAVIEVGTLAEDNPTHAGEQFCCLIAKVALLAVVGVFVAADGAVAHGQFPVSGLPVTLGGLALLRAMFNTNVDLPPLEAECHRDGDRVVCRYEIALNGQEDPCDPAAATINLDALSLQSDALVLSGRLQQRFQSAPAVAHTNPSPFRWHGPTHTCRGTEGDWLARSTFTVSQVGGNFPLKICRVLPVGPMAPFYKARIVWTNRCPTNAQPLSTAAAIHVTTPLTVGNPDPVPILVLTNVGATVVMVPPVPSLSDADRLAHEAEVKQWRLEHCLIFVDDWYDWDNALEVRWTLAPAPTSAPDAKAPTSTRRLWRIHAGGLADGEELHIGRGDGAEPPLAISRADDRRPIRVELLEDADHLTVQRRRGTADVEPSAAPYGLQIDQVLLEEIDVRTLDVPARGIRSLARGEVPTVEVILDGQAQRPERFTVDVGGFIDPLPSPTGGTNGTDDAPHEGPRPNRSTMALAPASLLPERLDVRTARPTGRRHAWLVDLPDGGHVEIDARGQRATTRYRSRPWIDGLVPFSSVLVRLDDDGKALRTYRPVDSLRL